MTRILHILPKTPVGGVGAFLKNTQKSINKEFVFDYLIIEDVENSNFIEFVQKRESNVYLLNEKLSIWNFYKIRVKIDEILQKNKLYDIVHLHSANIATLVFPVCKKNEIKIRILHSHSTRYSDNILKSIRNFLIEIPMFYYTTNFIACSNVSGKFLFKKRNFEIVYNGVDTNKYQLISQSRTNNKIILGNVGNFVSAKNHVFLIKLFRKLCQKRENYELWLFGDGELKDKINKKVHDYKLENKVFFYGRVDDMEKYYNDIDILLIPSKYEGFPVAAMEAQSYGIPIIASKNITKEIDLFEDNKFISTRRKDIDKWIDKIINLNLNTRNNKVEIFRNSKFTIEETTRTLEGAYFKFLRGGKI